MKLLAVLAAILFVTGYVFGANPSYGNFKGTGGITISSNPPQGDITIDGSSISASGTNVPASSSIPGRSMTNLLWSNTLFVDSTNGTNATAIRGDMSKPWRDVRSAISNAVSGDCVYLREGIHDAGSNTVVVPDGVKLIGQGFGSILRGNGELLMDGPVVVPGSTSEVAHIRIENSGRDFYPAATLGFNAFATNGAQRGPTNAYVHDLLLIGDTDNVYLRATNHWTVRGHDIYSFARFDSFVQLVDSSNGLSRWKDCYFEADLKGALAPYSLSTGNATAVKVAAGVAEFVSCEAVGTNGASSGVSFATRALAVSAVGKVLWSGGSLKAAGTNNVFVAEVSGNGRLTYLGNELLGEHVSVTFETNLVWGSQQAFLTNITYAGPNGLIFQDRDRFSDPIYFSYAAGVNIGGTNDPGAARLQVGSLPGSGDFVASDPNGVLFSTNGVSSQSVTSIVTSFFSSSTNSSGLPFTNLLWGRTLFVDSEYGNDATARKGDVSKPWLNAHVALTNAIAGDIVYLREGVHDIGVNLFHVGHGVKVTGAGSGSVLRGQGGLLTNGPVVCLTGSTGEVSHITIENSKREFYRTAAIGMFGAATNRSEGGTNMVIHDLTLIGTANNIYLRSTNSWTLRGWNLLAYSKWACFSQFAESSNAVSRWNACYFESDMSGTTNSDAVAQGNSTAVNVEGGVAEFIACDAVATNGFAVGISFGTTALGVTGLGGVTRWNGGNLKAAGSNDVRVIRSTSGTLFYIGNQLASEEVTGNVIWGSEQSIISNLVYTANGLVIDDVDRLNTPIKISSQGGMSIGNLADPGAGQLAISNMTGTGSFVMADASGKLIRTNAPAGGGGAFGADGLVQYANNGTNKAEAAFSYDEGDDTLSISNMVAQTLQIYNSIIAKSLALHGGNVTISNAAPQVTRNSYSSTASLSGQSLDQRYRGDETSPTAIQEGDILGSWQMLGYGDTVLRNAATLETSALGPFSDTSSAGLFVIKMGKTNSGTVKQTVFSATANNITNDADVNINSNLTVAGTTTLGSGNGSFSLSTNYTMEGVPTLTPSVDRVFTNAAAGVLVRLPVGGNTNQQAVVTLTEGQYLTYDGTGYVASNLPTAGTGNFSTNAAGVAVINGINGRIVAGNLASTFTNALFATSDTITNHAEYAFIDLSVIQYLAGGTIGHASFDATPTIQGTVGSDHHHAYQDASLNTNSGTLGTMASFSSNMRISAGTVSHAAAVDIWNPSTGWTRGSSTINGLFGVYVRPLTGASSNYAFYSEGATPSYFGGAVKVGGLLTDVNGNAYSTNAPQSTNIFRYVATTNVVSLTVDDIPQGYNTLNFRVYGRGTNLTSQDVWSFRVNDDSAAHYYRQFLGALGSTVSASFNATLTGGVIGGGTASNSLPSMASMGTTEIPEYSNPYFGKVAHSAYSTLQNTNGTVSVTKAINTTFIDVQNPITNLVIYNNQAWSTGTVFHVTLSK